MSREDEVKKNVEKDINELFTRYVSLKDSIVKDAGSVESLDEVPKMFRSMFGLIEKTIADFVVCPLHDHTDDILYMALSLSLVAEAACEVMASSPDTPEKFAAAVEKAVNGKIAERRKEADNSVDSLTSNMMAMDHLSVLLGMGMGGPSGEA